MKRIGIIIPAGGSGTRMVATDGAGAAESTPPQGTAQSPPKQFMLLGGRPILARVIDTFRSVVPEADIVVALPADGIDRWADMCREYDVPPHKICEGGATRFGSVMSALHELDPGAEYIAVHDAARPLVSPGLIVRAFETAHAHGSAIPAIPMTDSVRRLTEGGSYPEKREELRGVQTPQVFRADIFRTAFGRAVGDVWGDEATVVESVGYTVMLMEGERRNIKITAPEDLKMAEALIE